MDDQKAIEYFQSKMTFEFLRAEYAGFKVEAPSQKEIDAFSKVMLAIGKRWDLNPVETDLAIGQAFSMIVVPQSLEDIFSETTLPKETKTITETIDDTVAQHMEAFETMLSRECVGLLQEAKDLHIFTEFMWKMFDLTDQLGSVGASLQLKLAAAVTDLVDKHKNYVKLKSASGN
jgi:hypothetical protein